MDNPGYNHLPERGACEGALFYACNPQQQKRAHINMDELERNQSKRALTKCIEGGFYFHPADEDQSAGTPVGKSHCAVVLSGYSYSDSAIWPRSRYADEQFGKTGSWQYTGLRDLEAMFMSPF